MGPAKKSAGHWSMLIARVLWTWSSFSMLTWSLILTFPHTPFHNTLFHLRPQAHRAKQLMRDTAMNQNGLFLFRSWDSLVFVLLTESWVAKSWQVSSTLLGYFLAEISLILNNHSRLQRQMEVHSAFVC